jgi:hypothetical protein
MASRDDNSDIIIRNQDTIIQRAWVERAIESVRRRLENNEELPPVAEEQPPGRPHLYLVHSARKR